MINIKILLIATLLFASLSLGCGATPKLPDTSRPIPMPGGGLLIPKMGNTVFTICGLPVILVIHNKLGVEVYAGEDMVERAQTIDPDTPMSVAEISRTWGDQMMQCPADSDGTNAPVKKKPREWYAGY